MTGQLAPRTPHPECPEDGPHDRHTFTGLDDRGDGPKWGVIRCAGLEATS